MAEPKITMKHLAEKLEHIHKDVEKNSNEAENQKTRVYDIQGDFQITFPSGTTTQPDTIGDGADPTTTTY